MVESDTKGDPRFLDYIRQLTTLDEFLIGLEGDGLTQSFQTVDTFSLTAAYTFPGKNKARVVRDPFVPPGYHVFKGFDFGSYLEHGPDFDTHQRETMLNEIRTLAAMPAHPNVMECPRALVVVHHPWVGEGTPHVCGFLQPVMERQSLDDQITTANKVGTRISLSRKARWCHGMARAIMHTHRAGGTYHMDVKPGNMLIDDADEIRLIDWEQSGVSMFTHSKEVTIDQEAYETEDLVEEGCSAETDSLSGHDRSFNDMGDGGNHTRTAQRRRIAYKPRMGPKRKNNHWGYPDWNVFPGWKLTCPRAAELAEVFSLGRVAWMLLEQVEQTNKPTAWTEKSDDIPRGWVDMAMRCQREDPNERPELDEVVAFWRAEAEAQAQAQAQVQAQAQAETFGKRRGCNQSDGQGQVDKERSLLV